MKRRTHHRIVLALLAAYVLVVTILAIPSRWIPFTPVSEALHGLRINLGLDLQGGLHLEYALDTDAITDGNGNGTTADEKENALAAVQSTVERRVNAFGVGEPIVQRIAVGEEQRLVVELPGIRDIEGAKSVIKETPFLDFREDASDDPEVKKTIEKLAEEARKRAEEVLRLAQEPNTDFAELARTHSEGPLAAAGGDMGFIRKGASIFGEEFDAAVFDTAYDAGTVIPRVVESPVGWHIIKIEEERTVTQPKRDVLTREVIEGEMEDVREVRARQIVIAKPSLETLPQLAWRKTALSGAQLESADYDPGTANAGGVAEPSVLLHFNDEGTRLFAEITKGHIGERFAIFVDNQLVSAPVIQAEITNGQAQITGNFTPQEAKRLAQRLNEGALPVPITLVSQQSVDASLGLQALSAGLKAGAAGLALTMLYMIAYYRFFGLIAALSLGVYAATVIALFKLSSLLPGGLAITLTLSGIAGFILSVGMAVDANILVFERIREERKKGKTLKSAVAIGFQRAWSSIRDGNISTLLICVILIGMGSGFVKGFALILCIGVLVSMFTAVVLMRAFLRIIATERLERFKWLIGA